MNFPTSISFTPLANLSLHTPHLLNPAACNPTMDLVVLLSPPSDGSPNRLRAPQGWGSGKGKGKATDTRVELWRMGGNRAWEVDVGGVIAGMGWSWDGLVLSLLVLDGDNSKLEHRSVHNGQVVTAVPLTLVFGTDDKSAFIEGRRWCTLEWRECGLDWEKPQNGSAIMIIDSLPRVTPVEPPQPAVLNPFAKPVAPKPTGPHPNLATFPSLLSTPTPPPPDILTLTPLSGAAMTLLTGTLSLPSIAPSREVLGLAQISDRMGGLLDVVLRGLEGAEHAFRDGQKQTMIWREELETCGEQQGMSHAEVHADLFKLLMVGRAGAAIAEWLGNRLTGRTITKWEASLDSAYRTIGKLMAESVIPALERIVLLLEELLGRARAPHTVGLDETAVERAIDVACGFVKLAEQLRQDAMHETLASGEWMEWLKYEIARIGHDASAETMPLATHDLKLVWSYMTNGFVSSVFQTYFPDLPLRPPKDELPSDALAARKPHGADLTSVLRESLGRLSRRKTNAGTAGTAVATSPANADADSSLTSAFDKSLPSPLPDESISIRPESPDHDEEDVESDDDASQSGTAGRKDAESTEVRRRLEREPWVWANTLVKACEGLVRGGIGWDGELSTSQRVRDGLYDERHDKSRKWAAYVPPSSHELFLLCSRQTEPEQHSAIRLNLVDATCLALQFFDDEELVLLLQSDSKERYLITVDYSALNESLIPLGPGDLAVGGVGGLLGLLNDQAPIDLPISRCRPLTSLPSGEVQSEAEAGPQGGSAAVPERIAIALNGRQGRRVGCVMMGQGRDVEVLDMEADEDAMLEDEEGEEAEDEHMDEDE